MQAGDRPPASGDVTGLAFVQADRLLDHRESLDATGHAAGAVILLVSRCDVPWTHTISPWARSPHCSSSPLLFQAVDLADSSSPT